MSCSTRVVGLPEKLIPTFRTLGRSECTIYRQLRLENSDEVFEQIYLCQFIDSTQSAFNLTELERCYSDQVLWTDFDPSRTRDNATCVVAPPLEPGGKFRILEKHSWRGHSFTYQSAQINKLCERFNVQHTGIDITGVGYGVFDLGTRFLPARHADPLQLGS